jgi:hypothetical protein
VDLRGEDEVHFDGQVIGQCVTSTASADAVDADRPPLFGHRVHSHGVADDVRPSAEMFAAPSAVSVSRIRLHDS